jgi:predicted transcriptional regulator
VYSKTLIYFQEFLRIKDKLQYFLSVISKRKEVCVSLIDYFDYIIKQLSIDEVSVLGILKDQDATAAFKSVRKSKLHVSSKMTLATFRKTIEKLKATRLIDVVTARKEHKVYLTSYGSKALETLLKEVPD